MIHFLLALMLVFVTGISSTSSREQGSAKPYSASCKMAIQAITKRAEIWTL